MLKIDSEHFLLVLLAFFYFICINLKYYSASNSQRWLCIQAANKA